MRRGVRHPAFLTSLAVSAGLALLLASCESPQVVINCTDIEVMGIRATARDSITGAVIQADLIRVVAREGATLIVPRRRTEA